MIAEKAKAPILPGRSDGPHFTAFSRVKGRLRRRWFPPVTITLQEPHVITLSDDIKGRRRRREIGLKLYGVMSAMMFETAETQKTLFGAVLDARGLHGGARAILDDVERKPLTYGRLVAGSFVLGRRFAQASERGERVGALLPNANAAVATFLALQAAGRVPAMLNFSTGPRTMLAAGRLAGVRAATP